MVTVIVIIIVVFKVLDYITAKNRKEERAINPPVIEMVKDGKTNEEGMKARIGKEEYLSFMRLAGVRRIQDIELYNLEINGQISFIRKES
jgi:uncharacterized membrane protein YcaP (DUF421 family)